LTTLLLVVSTPAVAEAKTLLVLPFENQTDDRNMDWLGEGITQLIADRLSGNSDVYVFDRDERLAAYGRMGIPETVSISRASAVKLGWELGADAIVSGRMTGTHENFIIEARVIDLASLRLGEEYKVTGILDDVIQMTGTLSGEIFTTVAEGTLAPAVSAIPRTAFENYVRAILTADLQRRTDLLKEAVRLHPTYNAALYQLGHAYNIDRNFKGSNEPLEKIANGSREYVQAQFLRGLNNYYLGDFAAASSIFSGLPPTYDVLLNLGASLASQGNSAGAALAWNRASEADPLGADAVFNLGYSSFTRGDMDGAVRDLERFMKLEGRDGEALFLLGRAYERVGRIDESRRMISQATRLSPRVERWLIQPIPNLQRLSTEPDLTKLRTRAADPLWNTERLARRASSQDVNVWIENAQTQLDSQLYGEAIRQLQEAARIFPSSVDVQLVLARVYLNQKDYEKALQSASRALALDPNHTEARSLRDGIGRILMAEPKKP
jgi:tetratricopeptide (TPR) repeat protein/TolB-like protein